MGLCKTVSSKAMQQLVCAHCQLVCIAVHTAMPYTHGICMQYVFGTWRCVVHIDDYTCTAQPICQQLPSSSIVIHTQSADYRGVHHQSGHRSTDAAQNTAHVIQHLAVPSRIERFCWSLPQSGSLWPTSMDGHIWITHVLMLLRLVK
jgi:hypothetical protein